MKKVLANAARASTGPSSHGQSARRTLRPVVSHPSLRNPVAEVPGLYITSALSHGAGCHSRMHPSRAMKAWLAPEFWLRVTFKISWLKSARSAQAHHPFAKEREFTLPPHGFPDKSVYPALRMSERQPTPALFRILLLGCRGRLIRLAGCVHVSAPVVAHAPTLTALCLRFSLSSVMGCGTLGAWYYWKRLPQRSAPGRRFRFRSLPSPARWAGSGFRRWCCWAGKTPR